MSYCPAGTQAEKAILPVLDLLRDKVSFELKFVDYLMHGQDELGENLRQYCLAQQEPEKLLNYLTCFLKEGKASGCLATIKVDTAKLASCEKATDAKFNLNKNFKDEGSWSNGYPPFSVSSEDNVKHEVSGSPTLVINETKVAMARNPEAVKQLICETFTQQPEECKTKLSAETPVAGFGEGTSTQAGGGCSQ